MEFFALGFLLLINTCLLTDKWTNRWTDTGLDHIATPLCGPKGHRGAKHDHTLAIKTWFYVTYKSLICKCIFLLTRQTHSTNTYISQQMLDLCSILTCFQRRYGTLCSYLLWPCCRLSSRSWHDTEDRRGHWAQSVACSTLWTQWPPVSNNKQVTHMKCRLKIGTFCLQ